MLPYLLQLVQDKLEKRNEPDHKVYILYISLKGFSISIPLSDFQI